MEKILFIFVCPDKGQSMVSLDYIEALTGKGLYEDRYALEKGSWSKNEPFKRQFTFISIEGITEANKELENPFLPEDTRRNIVTKGIDLNSLVGKKFKIGSVIFKGTELCDPCDRPSRLADKQGFRKAFNNRGGIRAEIISGGMITIGQIFLKLDL